MSRDHPDTGKTRGSASCALCGARVLVKVNRKGLLYYNCSTTDDGCGSQIQPRTADAEKLLAQQIEKWNDPEQRRAYLGDAAIPAKARKPADPVDPPADPVTPPPAAPDAEEADDAPAEIDSAPPARPAATRKRAAGKRTPPAPEKPVRLFGKWS